MFQFYMFCIDAGYWPAPEYLEIPPFGLIDSLEGSYG